MSILKQRNIRMTDEEYDNVKGFLSELRSGISRPIVVDPWGQFSDDTRAFLDNALKWWDAMINLFKIGAIDAVPNPFEKTFCVCNSGNLETNPPVAEDDPDNYVWNKALPDDLCIEILDKYGKNYQFYKSAEQQVISILNQTYAPGDIVPKERIRELLLRTKTSMDFGA